MITIRLRTKMFDEFVTRVKRSKPGELLEARNVGETFKEVRTSLKKEEAEKLCKGLGPLHISEV